MERRRCNLTEGRLDGKTEERRDGDIKRRRNDGTEDGWPERRNSERSNRRRATAVAEKLDDEISQRMNRKIEGRREEAPKESKVK